MSRRADSLLLILVAACGGNEPGTVTADAGPRRGDDCAAGATRCDGDTLLICEDGELVVGESCAGTCVDGIGCAACEPGTGTCAGDRSTMCRPDGSGFDDVWCDPDQGLGCDPDTGLCAGDCAPQPPRRTRR
jgi:hypothetical protein